MRRELQAVNGQRITRGVLRLRDSAGVTGEPPHPNPLPQRGEGTAKVHALQLDSFASTPVLLGGNCGPSIHKRTQKSMSAFGDRRVLMDGNAE